MLVFKLDEDDAAAAVNLIGNNDGKQLPPETGHVLFKSGVGGADLEAWHVAQPDGITTTVPLGAIIRPHPGNGVESQRLGEFKIRVQVGVGGEIELAALRFVKIPKGVELGAVEAGALEACQPVRPKSLRNPGVFHARGSDKNTLAIEQKPFSVEIDHRSGGGLRGKHAVICARAGLHPLRQRQHQARYYD